MLKNAYFQMHISILLWGFTGIFGKLIQLQEGYLVWYRMLITSVILYGIAYYSKAFKGFKWKDLPNIALIGFLIMLHWLSFYGAIKYSNVSITLSCFSCVTLFTAFLEPLLHKRPISKVELMLGLMVITGIYLIFAFQQLYATGIILAIISAFLGALFSTMNKHVVMRYNPLLVTTLELSTGFLWLCLFLPLYLYLFPANKALPSNIDWLYLILLSFFCTVIPFTLSLKALQKLSPFTMNLSLNLEPIYSILLAFWLFKENKLLGWGFYAGTAIILSSVAIYSIYKYRLTQRPNTL